jgi:hypothetical protein
MPCLICFAAFRMKTLRIFWSADSRWNGRTYESLERYRRTLIVDGVEIQTLDIEGLLNTKTDYRHKDRIDREALERLRELL